MKKAFLFLSGMVAAIGSYAADGFEPGTAEAPNYYVFKAGRGTPYLAYSSELLTTPTGVKTNVCRTSKLTADNIWEVTPGSSEGSVIIRSYANRNEYLLAFTAGNGVWNGELNATATTTQSATDIYPLSHGDNFVSLCLIDNEAGYESNGNGGWSYYTLDASNNSDFCGNWISNDVGTNWYCIRLDMTNGVESALAGAKNATAEEKRNSYLSSFNSYINAVPWVADELNEGIEALKNLVIDNDYETKMDNIWVDATSKADKKLASIFNNKTVAIKNTRRVYYNVSPYLAVTNADSKNVYGGAYSFADSSTAFTFKSDGKGGYKLYNEVTETWLSTSCEPTTDASAAAVIYPRLYWMDGCCGLALPLTEKKNGCDGMNFQSWETGIVSFYTIDDEGSIWSIEDVAEKDKHKDVIDSYVAQLEPYIENVPPEAAQIINDAIELIKGLSYSDNIISEAEGIINDALDSVNESLVTELDGKEFNIKSLFVNKYLSINNDEWEYALTNENVNTNFTFIRVGLSDAFIIYNRDADLYLGLPIAGDGTENYDVYDATTVKNMNDAMVVYPKICKGARAYQGIAIALSRTFTGAMPSPEASMLKACTGSHCLHAWRSYYLNSIDENSIFALRPAGSSGLTEVVSNSLDILATDGGVIVRNAPSGEQIAIYSIDGKLVNSTLAKEGETAINLSRGIYVVKVSALAVEKVLIR